MRQSSTPSRFRALQLALGVAWLALVATSAMAATAADATGDHVIYAAKMRVAISVPIYQSRIVDFTAPVSRVTVGSPDIADVIIINTFQVYVVGKDMGNTNIMVWDRGGTLISAISVTVTHDLAALRQKLAQILPNEHIGVTSAHHNIVLYGQVSGLVQMDAALQVAKSYIEQTQSATPSSQNQKGEPAAPGETTGTGSSQNKNAGTIINLMRVAGPQQVMLQVRVAEVQRNALKHINLLLIGITNFGKWVGGAANGGNTTFPPVKWLPQNAPYALTGQPGTSGIVGPDQSIVTPSFPGITASGLFGSYLSGSIAANAVLDAFRQEGLAKILAEPTLTTESGHEAQFLSGGSFPIPVPEQNGVIGIQYKDFGVKLGFVPLIMQDGRINLKLNVSVSELTSTNSLTVSPITSSSVFAVPAITERRASSTLVLADGQTIGIAGLMNDEMQTAEKKFPLLGSLPILGALFRSQDFQDGRTELVILVTPRLAKPLPATGIHLPTDAVVPPSNAGFFLFGKMQGSKPKPKAPTSTAPASVPPGATSSPPSHP